MEYVGFFPNPGLLDMKFSKDILSQWLEMENVDMEIFDKFPCWCNKVDIEIINFLKTVIMQILAKKQLSIMLDLFHEQ